MYFDRLNDFNSFNRIDDSTLSTIVMSLITK